MFLYLCICFLVLCIRFLDMRPQTLHLTSTDSCLRCQLYFIFCQIWFFRFMYLCYGICVFVFLYLRPQTPYFSLTPAPASKFTLDCFFSDLRGHLELRLTVSSAVNSISTLDLTFWGLAKPQLLLLIISNPLKHSTSSDSTPVVVLVTLKNPTTPDAQKPIWHWKQWMRLALIFSFVGGFPVEWAEDQYVSQVQTYVYAKPSTSHRIPSWNFQPSTLQECPDTTNIDTSKKEAIYSWLKSTILLCFQISKAQ